MSGLRDRFRPHEDEDNAVLHEQVYELCGELASRLDDLLPEGREKSLAGTKLEEVMFWANAGIARSGAA